MIIKTIIMRLQTMCNSMYVHTLCIIICITLGQTDFQGQQCLVPTHVSDGLNSVHVLQIACGSSHTLFLSDMVYAFILILSCL